MKKGKKQIKKKEVSDKEIARLEKQLKKQEDKDSSYGCPTKPSANIGMNLVLTFGEFAVFRNTNGILHQIGFSQEANELVLKKIKVVN